MILSTFANNDCHIFINLHEFLLLRYWDHLGSGTAEGLGCQGPSEHLSDIKCNCYCHLHVHYIIISIFIFLIFGVLCGRVRLGWGPNGDDWTVWYGQIYIYFDSIYPYHYIYGIIFHGWRISTCFVLLLLLGWKSEFFFFLHFFWPHRLFQEKQLEFQFNRF